MADIERYRICHATPAKIERYMFHKTNSTFHLMPRLADRSVVIRPVDPIYIPAGQRGTFIYQYTVVDRWSGRWSF